MSKTRQSPSGKGTRGSKIAGQAHEVPRDLTHLLVLFQHKVKLSMHLLTLRAVMLVSMLSMRSVVCITIVLRNAIVSTMRDVVLLITIPLIVRSAYHGTLVLSYVQPRLKTRAFSTLKNVLILELLMRNPA
jgi:hypothetical protein